MLVNTAVDVICCDVPRCPNSALAQGREIEDWRMTVLQGQTFLICPDHFLVPASMMRFVYLTIACQIVLPPREG